MSKVGITELAQALANKHGLDTKDAELFVERMFEVLNEALRHEKQVKLKGLGTFKVISVSPRKSIDVNTGEPIVIEGREKISFTPDVSMRDLVNRPFSQFETTVVNDGVDFSDIDNRMPAELSEEESEDEEPAAEPANSPEPIAEIAAVEPVAESQPESPAVAASLLSAMEPEQEYSAQSKPMTEPTAEDEIEEDVTEDDNQEEEVALVDFSDNPTVETQEEQTNATEQDIARKWETAREHSENEVLTVANNQLREEIARSHKLIKGLIAGVALLLLAVIGGAYYVGRQISIRDNRILHLEAEHRVPNPIVKPSVTAKRAVARRSVAVKPAASAPAVTQQTAAQSQPKQQNTQTPAQPATKAKVQQPIVASPYDSDPRVRTGAYRIVGVANTVTVKKGQTLSSISRTYLGPGMECYVEALNGGIKTAEAGQKVKIPELQLRKKR
ncbi:HU family DNA-binding protein [Prevotella sp. kh1p2]|uniref:HU family DNA-binding protein n=1 Tax=Prevotella sp. kh1p2 TaxID=1761883 RepID=UPI0008B6A4B9|nr:HU family DNA-binding protein [Prevotella sp. kh1p2]SET04343.1 nucleoid DNA-binding protein [Prevotella sp. kh1p2]SNU11712.1 nucleoid DNA-binding protein [Prevotellaceae bacterium KH2P17]